MGSSTITLSALILCFCSRVHWKAALWCSTQFPGCLRTCNKSCSSLPGVSFDMKILRSIKPGKSGGYRRLHWTAGSHGVHLDSRMLLLPLLGCTVAVRLLLAVFVVMQSSWCICNHCWFWVREGGKKEGKWDTFLKALKFSERTKMQLLTPLFFYASSADLWLCTISRLEHLRSFPEGIAQCDQHLSSTSHPFSNCTRLYNCQCCEGSI